MALSRLATDGVINGRKNQHKLDQTAWRGRGKRNNYGQVLKGGGRPSDQPVDGPSLPLNPLVAADARIDVYEAPNGYGWVATFEAEEAAVRYSRTVASHEDRALVETGWVKQ